MPILLSAVIEGFTSQSVVEAVTAAVAVITVATISLGVNHVLNLLKK